MTDEQIIKALENRIFCTDRDNLVDNSGVTFGDILDLINRQKAEIEKLKSRDEEFLLKNYSFDKYYDEHIKKAKAEAIQEFAERLINTFPKSDTSYIYYDHYCEIIKDVAEEMTEGKQ